MLEPQMHTDTHRLKFDWYGCSTSEAFHLDSVFAKVKEETYRRSRSLQIVDALCLMNFIKIFDSFEFDKHQILDKQIGDVIAHDNSVIPDGDRMLLRDPEACLAYFVRHRVLVNFLKKATAQFISNSKSASNNFFGNLI